MKRPKLGPELKLSSLKPSEVKVPPFVSDLYWDLRERRLLPLVALVIVAIVAVPFLLGGKSGEGPASGKVAISSPPAGTGAARSSRLVAVEAKPGLRDYHKRLSHRSPTDPFVQRYTAPSIEGAELGGGETGNSDSSVASTVTTGSGSSTVGTTVTSSPSPEPTSPSSKTQPTPGSHLFGFRPDVRFGVAGSNELTMHEELKVGTFLPEHDPIVIFIGVTQNGTRALFDVSPEVWSVQGDSNCVGGEENCHILSLREGEAVTLKTENERAFRLAVARIRFVEVHVSSKASSSASKPIARGLGQNFSN